MAVVWLLISQSLPSNRSVCLNTNTTSCSEAWKITNRRRRMIKEDTSNPSTQTLNKSRNENSLSLYLFIGLFLKGKKPSNLNFQNLITPLKYHA
jgi:hypothetical protein